MVQYPTVEDIISLNAKVISEIKVKKAYRHEVLSEHKISKVLEGVQNEKGDLYDKAVVLFKGLIQNHPFGSGNRRTAFVAVENFLLYNGENPKVNKDENASILQGIREGYYPDAEIKNWLKGGKIHEFKRK